MLSKRPRILQYLTAKIRADEPGDIHPVHGILTKYVENRKIISFEKLSPQSRLDTRILLSPAYRVVYLKERYFDFVLRRPNVYRPFDGIAVAEEHEHEVIVFIDDHCPPEQLARCLLEQINHRLKGFQAENSFTRKTLDLVDADGEVSSLITWVATSTDYQDKFSGADRVIILRANSCVPIQIKCSKFEQQEHKKNHPLVPSLVWKNHFLNGNSLFKELLLKICTSYVRGVIEHL